MIRHLLLVLLSVLLVPGASAQVQDTLRLTLDQAVIRALEVSPEVGAADAQRRFAAARSRFASANRYFTTFRLTTLHTLAPGLHIPDGSVPTDQLYLDPDVRNDWSSLRPFNHFAVEVQQPIFTFGELGGNIRAARHAVDVERAEVRGTASEVALRTAEIYQGMMLAGALMRLTSEAENVLNTARRELERMLDEGSPDVDDADLFKLQITEQEFLSQVTDVRQQLATAQTALRRQLMLPDGAVVRAVDQRLEPIAVPLDTLNRYLELAALHRHELQMAAAGIQAREGLLEAARSGYYPTVFLAGTADLGLVYGRYRQPNPFVGDRFLGRNAGAALGLRMNLNIAQTRAEVEQARAQLNEVRFQQDAAEQLVAFDVEEAYRQAIMRRTRMETRERSLNIAREWLRTEQINFDLGFGSAQNLIDAVQMAMQLEAGHLEAIHDYNRAVLRLLSASGVLVNQIRGGNLSG